MMSEGVGEVVGVGEELVLNDVEKEGSPGKVEDELSGRDWEGFKKMTEDELSEGTGDWLGFKKTVEMMVMVTGSTLFEGVEEKGSAGGVEEGLANGSTEEEEEGSTGGVEEGLANGSTVEEGLTGGVEEGLANGSKEEEGSTENVEEGSTNGPTEDGSMDGTEEGGTDRVEDGGTENTLEDGSTGVETEVDPPGGMLLESLPSNFASLRERSGCLSTKRAHQTPRMGMSVRYIIVSLVAADAPLQGSLAARCLPSKGTAETSPREATKTKVIKDLKVIVIASDVWWKKSFEGSLGCSRVR